MKWISSASKQTKNKTKTKQNKQQGITALLAPFHLRHTKKIHDIQMDEYFSSLFTTAYASQKDVNRRIRKEGDKKKVYTNVARWAKLRSFDI